MSQINSESQCLKWVSSLTLRSVPEHFSHIKFIVGEVLLNRVIQEPRLMVVLSSSTSDFSDHLRFKKMLSNGRKQKGLTKQLNKIFILFLLGTWPGSRLYHLFPHPVNWKFSQMTTTNDKNDVKCSHLCAQKEMPALETS